MLYHLKSVQKKMTCFHCCINLTKHEQGLYAENWHKTLIKEIKNHLTKSQWPFFVDINKLILKLIWNGKRNTIATTIFKNHKLAGITIPSFETYHRPTVMETVCCWSGQTHRMQQQRAQRSMREFTPLVFFQHWCENS